MESRKWLKHFIIQQMHKHTIRRYNENYYKTFKIFKIAQKYFGSQGMSASLDCAVHTHTMPL